MNGASPSDRAGRGVRRGAGRSGLVAVLLTAATMAAVLVVPGMVLGRGPVTTGPSDPRQTRALDPSGPQEWRPVDCPGFNCATPRRLSYEGIALSYLDGTNLATSGERGTTLRWRVRGDTQRWVLVGATGTGERAELRVIFGAADPVGVPPGRLSLLRVPENASTVYLLERGEPATGEVLRIAEYQPEDD